MNKENGYSGVVKSVFWLAWVMGAVVLMAFLLLAIFVMQMAGELKLISFNLCVVLVEGYLLLKSARYFNRREKTPSELLLWVGLAAIAVPLVAYGGCLMVGFQSAVG